MSPVSGGVVEWLRDVHEHVERVARAACESDGFGDPPAGFVPELWAWYDESTDEPVPIDATQEHIDEGRRVGLRSTNYYPTRSVGPLPNMVLSTELILALHHPLQHEAVYDNDDPDLLSVRSGCAVCTLGPSCPHPPYHEHVVYPCGTVLALASGWRHMPGYDESWRPTSTGELSATFHRESGDCVGERVILPADGRPRVAAFTAPPDWPPAERVHAWVHLGGEPLYQTDRKTLLAGDTYCLHVDGRWRHQLGAGGRAHLKKGML